MATDTFLPASGTQAWDVPSNWSLRRVPLSTDDVVINGNNHLTVTISALDPAYTVASLTENDTSQSPNTQLEVDSGLTVTGATSLTSGKLSLGGSATVTLGTVDLRGLSHIDVETASSPTLTIGALVAEAVGGTGIYQSFGTLSVGSLSSGQSLYLNAAPATVVSSDGGNAIYLQNASLTWQPAATAFGELLVPGSGSSKSSIDLQNIAYQAGETVAPPVLTSIHGNLYSFTLKSADGQTAEAAAT